MTSALPAPDDEVEPLSFGRRTARLLAIVAVVLVAGMWSYALFWPHDTTPPGRLSEPTWSEAAQQVCAATAAQLATLPAAHLTPTPAERADTVARSDALLTSMLDSIDALPPPSDPTDARMVTEWRGDWRTYVADREAYAERLRTDPTTRFYVTIKDRRQVSEPIDFFANANRMTDCVTPDDIE